MTRRQDAPITPPLHVGDPFIRAFGLFRRFSKNPSLSQGGAARTRSGKLPSLSNRARGRAPRNSGGNRGSGGGSILAPFFSAAGSAAGDVQRRLDNLVAEFQQARNLANEENLQRYEQGLGVLGQGLGRTRDLLSGLGQAQLADIDHQVEQQRAAMLGSMDPRIASLTSASIGPQSALAGEAMRARLHAREGVQRMGLEAEIPQIQGISSFIERRHDQGPDFGQLAQLSQAAGQAGQQAAQANAQSRAITQFERMLRSGGGGGGGGGLAQAANFTGGAPIFQPQFGANRLFPIRRGGNRGGGLPRNVRGSNWVDKAFKKAYGLGNPRVPRSGGMAGQRIRAQRERRISNLLKNPPTSLAERMDESQRLMRRGRRAPVNQRDPRGWQGFSPSGWFEWDRG